MKTVDREVLKTIVAVGDSDDLDAVILMRTAAPGMAGMLLRLHGVVDHAERTGIELGTVHQARKIRRILGRRGGL